MVGQPWYGLLLALVAFQLLVAYYAHRARKQTDAAVTGDGGAAYVDAESGVVECPKCGAENELGYRYCRSCVATLPAATRHTRRAGSPFGRFTR